MIFKICLTCYICFLSYIWMYHQSDYRMKFDRIQINWYNKTMVGNPKVYFFRYNRSVAVKVLNASGHLKVDLSNKLWIHAQVYKFQSNEYRLFLINVTFDVCPHIRYNTFGTDDVWDYTNMSCCCPFKKGTYYLANYGIDQSTFPPYAIRGEFMVELSISLDKHVKLGIGQVYFKTEDIIYVGKRL